MYQLIIGIMGMGATVSTETSHEVWVLAMGIKRVAIPTVFNVKRFGPAVCLRTSTTFLTTLVITGPPCSLN
jgi:hypothetical protein